LSLVRKPSQQTSGSDEIEIRYAPLPPEKVEAYWESMRFIAKLLFEIANEDPYPPALSPNSKTEFGEREPDEEPSQVNNGTEPITHFERFNAETPANATSLIKRLP